MKPGRHPAQLQYVDLTRRYPGIWERCDQYHAQRGQGLPWWPEWCVLPIRMAAAAVADILGIPVMDLLGRDDTACDVTLVAAIYGWRRDKVVYRYTNQARHIAARYHLPLQLDFAAFAALSGRTIYADVAGDEGSGVWAHLEWDHRVSQPPELRLIRLDRAGRVTPIPILLAGGTVESALVDLMMSAEKQSVVLGHPRTFSDIEKEKRTVESSLRLISHLLSTPRSHIQPGRRDGAVTQRLVTG